MVDAEAEVPRPGAGLVVPKGVGGSFGLQGADGVGETEPEERAVAGAGFRADQGVGEGQGAGGEVHVGRADIVVAGQDQGAVGVQEGSGAGGQGLHPGELVGVARGAAGVAVWQIEVADGDAVGLDFEVAGLGVVQAGQGALGDLDGDAGEDGDAVVGFLADDFGLVAGGMESQGGEACGFALDFLQEQEVRLGAGEPVHDQGFANADGVDVPGGDLHGGHAWAASAGWVARRVSRRVSRG